MSIHPSSYNKYISLVKKKGIPWGIYTYLAASANEIRCSGHQPDFGSEKKLSKTAAAWGF